MPLRLLAVLALLVAPLVAPGTAGAQVRPDLTWRTLHTPHFRIHFNPWLEDLARRTAANAEYAYARLRTELTPPRGVIDLVLADNVDYANGYATPYPTNRMVVYARPPVEAMALRNHVDWNLALVTHELAHLFHLDRTRGWWRAAQWIFGRAAPLFPNTYSPSWMIEGLAVHYETRFAGTGRLSGSEFPAFVRAAALHGHLPALNELSLATPRFPGGNVSYIYGAYAMTRAEPGEMGRFVEASSGRLIPWLFKGSAEKAFGESFSERWDEWRDSVRHAVASAPDSFGVRGDAERRTLTTHRFTARFPRWLDDTSLVYVADDARETPGLYRLSDAGRPDRDRLGRRNTIDVNVPLEDGRTLQAEMDWTNPYTLRGDLFVSGRGLFGRRRLTQGERLSSPDVDAASGRIVAVQTIEGTTHLVVIDELGDAMSRRLVGGSLDTTWAEPRWSGDGTRIAATRWTRGGRASIVVMDREGRELRAFTPHGRPFTIVSSPAWIPGDSALLFVSDHEGRAMIYRGNLRTGVIARAWGTATALNTPDVSPDGRRIAAVELGAEGFQVVTREMPAADDLVPMREATAEEARADSAARLRREMDLLREPERFLESKRYSAIESLMPFWWLPSFGEDDAGTYGYGLITGGRDLVDRHAWELTAQYEPTRREVQGSGAYSYSGLGNPVLTLFGAQEWLHGAVVDQNGDFFGLIGQREQSLGLSAYLERRRVRLTTYAAAGYEVNQFIYRTYPGWLLDTLDNAAYRSRITTETVEGEVGFSTLQRPGLSVSAEDGAAGSFTFRRRLGIGLQFDDVDELIAVLSAAKSLPLPGYAKHVIATRLAYATTGHQTTGAFAVGGVSGSSIELVPGVTFGDSRRNFFVRGFEPAAQLGVRAAAASVEYRAPLFLGGRGVSWLPFFMQKTTLTAFGDAGAGWCSFPVANSFICGTGAGTRTVMASVGGELAIDAALQYDRTYRFRLGYAKPVEGEEFARRSQTFYFTLGATF